MKMDRGATAEQRTAPQCRAAERQQSRAEATSWDGAVRTADGADSGGVMTGRANGTAEQAGRQRDSGQPQTDDDGRRRVQAASGNDGPRMESFDGDDDRRPVDPRWADP